MHTLCPGLNTREEDAAAEPAAAGIGGNKRKRQQQKGVDAILDLGPLDRGGESVDDEEDSADPFGQCFCFCF